MVEILESGPLMDTHEFNNFLETLAARCEKAMGKTLSIEYSGERVGPMAPLSFWWIAENVPKSRIGQLILTTEKKPVFIIYPSIYGLGLGKKEIFCAVYNAQIIDIAREEMRSLGERIQLTAIRMNVIYR